MKKRSEVKRSEVSSKRMVLLARFAHGSLTLVQSRGETSGIGRVVELLQLGQEDFLEVFRGVDFCWGGNFVRPRFNDCG